MSPDYMTVEAQLWIPPDTYEGGLVLYVPPGRDFNAFQIDQMVNLAIKNSRYDFDRQGCLTTSVGEPEIEGGEIRAVSVRLRTVPPSPGTQDWVAMCACEKCDGAGRIGFGGRLECELCADGAVAFRLTVPTSEGVSDVHVSRRSAGWRCSVRAPREVLHIVRRGRRWKRLSGSHEIRYAHTWPAVEDAVRLGERIAAEIREL